MGWKEELDEYSSSQFLSSKDLATGITKATMIGISSVDFKDEDRYQLTTKELKPLLLNKTNAKVIKEIADTKGIDELAGHTISLMKQKVNFQGELVDAVRIVDLE